MGNAVPFRASRPRTSTRPRLVRVGVVTDLVHHPSDKDSSRKLDRTSVATYRIRLQQRE